MKRLDAWHITESHSPSFDLWPGLRKFRQSAKRLLGWFKTMNDSRPQPRHEFDRGLARVRADIEDGGNRRAAENCLRIAERIPSEIIRPADFIARGSQGRTEP